MTQTSITARLSLLTAASAAVAILLFWIFHTYFSDILPLASTEAPPPSWRFQGAYMITCLIFISAAVAFMSLLGVIALIGWRYSNSASNITPPEH